MSLFLQLITFSGLVLLDSAARLLKLLNNKLRLGGGFNNKVLFSLFWFASEDASVKERTND